MFKNKEIVDLSKKMNVSYKVAKQSVEQLKKKIEEQEEKINYTASKEYLEWLYNFIKPDKIYDDESALYLMTDSKDKENLLMISYLQKYIEVLATTQSIENKVDNENSFQALNYIFRYRDRYYQIDTMIGQGAITFISICKNPYNREYILLG